MKEAERRLSAYEEISENRGKNNTVVAQDESFRVLHHPQLSMFLLSIQCSPEMEAFDVSVEASEICDGCICWLGVIHRLPSEWELVR